jgi:hypothetical protein
MIDAASLRDAFHISNTIASQRARWCAGDPGADPKLCRYCGKAWRKWPGSRLDGHAACIVTADFKQQLKEFLRPATVTYKQVADAIGVSESVVRSWTFPIKGSRR